LKKSIAPIFPIQAIHPDVCKGLSVFFTDIDDTLTWNGLVPAVSLRGIERLADAGVAVVPVTGRPAGWCDHIARMWPVAAVIGENGAFYFSYNRERKEMRRVFLQSEAERKAAQERRLSLTAAVEKRFSFARRASDQPFRMTDTAIDIREDRESLTKEELGELCGFLEREGAHYKVSSIHVNFWFGRYDKRVCLEQYLMERSTERRSKKNGPFDPARALFIGDSPNDEPLFAALPHTVAVSNIEPYLPALTHKPAYITTFPSADGFIETIDCLLEKREALS